MLWDDEKAPSVLKLQWLCSNWNKNNIFNPCLKDQIKSAAVNLGRAVSIKYNFLFFMRKLQVQSYGNSFVWFSVDIRGVRAITSSLKEHPQILGDQENKKISWYTLHDFLE